MKRPYHHGDLPAALLKAAAEILRNEGLAALTLRAVARRVGVSHMAPAPHFGDLEGLLSELAATGYRHFNDYLQRAQANPGERPIANATAQAYVAFAKAEPAMFLLMFRSERLDFTRPALAEAASDAQKLLMRSAGGNTADFDNGGTNRMKLIGLAIGRWSVVHGFAMLLIDGRLNGILAEPEFQGNVEALLDVSLKG